MALRVGAANRSPFLWVQFDGRASRCFWV